MHYSQKAYVFRLKQATTLHSVFVILD